MTAGKSETKPLKPFWSPLISVEREGVPGDANTASVNCCLHGSGFLKQAAVSEGPISYLHQEGLKATVVFHHEIEDRLVARPVGREVATAGPQRPRNCTPQPHSPGSTADLRLRRRQRDHDAAQSPGGKTAGALRYCEDQQSSQRTIPRTNRELTIIRVS
jgi:hypothetical protein